MDSIFNKFGLYDFMGIWGPGAIFVTYFSFTLYRPMHDFLISNGVSNPGFSNLHMVIILYTVIAYVVGVVLHELGRFIADLFNLFRANDIQLTISEDQKSVPSTSGFSKTKKSFKSFGKRLSIFKQIRLKNITKINSIINGNKSCEVSFETAISTIKFRNLSSLLQVDKHHSIYALARSLSLTFLLHLVVSLFVACHSYKTPNFSYAISPLYYICDCALAFLFFLRAYRYFYSWVKSVYLQYYYITNSKPNNQQEDAGKAS